MKKALTILLCTGLLGTFAACGGNAAVTNTPESAASEAVGAPVEEPQEEPTETEETRPAAEQPEKDKEPEAPADSGFGKNGIVIIPESLYSGFMDADAYMASAAEEEGVLSASLGENNSVVLRVTDEYQQNTLKAAEGAVVNAMSSLGEAYPNLKAINWNFDMTEVNISLDGPSDEVTYETIASMLYLNCAFYHLAGGSEYMEVEFIFRDESGEVVYQTSVGEG